MAKPKTKNPIHLLDLGAGRGERLHHFATMEGAENMRFVGIDVKPRPAILRDLHNVEWIQGLAEFELHNIGDESVHEVNSELFAPPISF
jgi:hypothetical protein